MFAAGAAHSATDIGGGQHLLKASGQYVTRGLHAAGGVLRELDLNIKLNFMLCKLCSMTGISLESHASLHETQTTLGVPRVTRGRGQGRISVSHSVRKFAVQFVPRFSGFAWVYVTLCLYHAK